MDKIEHFIPDDDVLERFAAAAEVSVSDVVSYYRFQGARGSVLDVARFFPPRRETSYTPDLEYIDGGNPVLGVGEKEEPKPWRPPPERRFQMFEDDEVETEATKEPPRKPRRDLRSILDPDPPRLFPPHYPGYR